MLKEETKIILKLMKDEYAEIILEIIEDIEKHDFKEVEYVFKNDMFGEYLQVIADGYNYSSYSVDKETAEAIISFLKNF